MLLGSFPKPPLTERARDARDLRALAMYEAGDSLREICAECGIATGQIYKLVDAAELPRRLRTTEEQAERIMPYVRKGVRASVIADRLGLHVNYVRQVIRTHKEGNDAPRS